MADIRYYHNPNGPTLGLSADSGVGILERDGLLFKDHARTGELLPFEDWRLSSTQRAEDLASRLEIDQLCALMMYSGHQMIPGTKGGPFVTPTYNGLPFDSSGAQKWELSDQQKEYIRDNDHRHLLVADIENAEDTVRWMNEMQALCEKGRYAIPCNVSSDPRHGLDHGAEYNSGAGRVVSSWPESIGLAATFDPELVKEFGRVVAEEYRALGMATALGPQIDLATEPRWSRLSGTFGESPKLSAALSKAICEGYQTTPAGEGVIESDGSSDSGWGSKSINAMPKHWPSGGPEEGGRDAHFAYGKYAVYPGGNFRGQMEPFTQGAFHLDGGTSCASAVMPYYTISWDQDKVYGENMGNSFSRWIISDLLRGEQGFDGVACTDWGIIMDPNPNVDDFAHTCWGVEHLTMQERFCKAIEVGIDMFGDVNEASYIREAYRIMSDARGEEAARRRFEQSAVRILKNMFRVGLFENPYLDPEESLARIACPEFVEKGLAAQRKSLILLKNREGLLPIPKGSRVYMPVRHTAASVSMFGAVPESWDDPLPTDLLERYYTRVSTPEEADFALVVIRAPQSGGGYDRADLQNGGNGYVPITLQYSPYTALAARKESIAGGDPRESFTNRTYFGKTVTTTNEEDLELVRATKARMGQKPVVTVVQFSNPFVPEFEPDSDAVLAHSGLNPEIVLEAVSGAFEPSGLLPVQMPASMETVEKQCEDVPFDMKCWVDTQGCVWDFAYGRNFHGVIHDDRTKAFR